MKVLINFLLAAGYWRVFMQKPYDVGRVGKIDRYSQAQIDG